MTKIFRMIEHFSDEQILKLRQIVDAKDEESMSNHCIDLTTSDHRKLNYAENAKKVSEQPAWRRDSRKWSNGVKLV